MREPDEDLRANVGRRAGDISDEEELESLLHDILLAVKNEAGVGSQVHPEDELAAIEAWASLASDAVARFYAPASPWPRNVAGWSARAAGRLRAISTTLSGVLTPLAPALGAQSFSIGVSFPWGIQVSLSW